MSKKTWIAVHYRVRLCLESHSDENFVGEKSTM